MNEQNQQQKQLSVLTRKLEQSISSRKVLEDDSKAQLSVLIGFIAKISLACKGIDISLDNKLAKLRSSFQKSVPFTDIESQVSLINELLQKHSLVNEATIRDISKQAKQSGLLLQQQNGLSAELRKKLRNLLVEFDDSKDALVQYVPYLVALLELYNSVIANKEKSASVGLLAQQNLHSNTISDAENKVAIDKFQSILGQLSLSDKHAKQMEELSANLTDNINNASLVTHFLTAFDIIVEDLNQERITAKAFLSSLSNTLTTVQAAVNTTITAADKNNKKHDILNNKLQVQVEAMSQQLTNALSLADLKGDISEKLQLIANTLQEKSALETAQRSLFKNHMDTLTSRVSELEAQSKEFEKRILEQQVNSMTDALTQLGNRAAFDQHFSKQMVKFHHNQIALGVVVLDLDNFKRINDTYGHTAGDKTLQVIAKTLKKQINSNTFIARYGGEEFVIVYTNVSQENMLKQLNVLRAQIAKLPFKFRNNKVSITVSVGATHVTKLDNVHVAFERADRALYQAKDNGKNCVVYI